MFILVVIVLFYFCCFTSSSPQRNIKAQRKESNTENKSESQTKRREKKKGIKEASDGPGELSSRGLDFLQRKFRYMFVHLFAFPNWGCLCAFRGEEQKQCKFQGRCLVQQAAGRATWLLQAAHCPLCSPA